MGAGITTDTALTDHPSLLDDAANAVGDEEKQKLTNGEMTLHNHDNRDYNYLVRIVGNYTSDGYDALGAGQIDEVHGAALLPARRDQPHNDMPPFVALYYCIRE